MDNDAASVYGSVMKAPEDERGLSTSFYRIIEPDYTVRGSGTQSLNKLLFPIRHMNENSQPDPRLRFGL